MKSAWNFRVGGFVVDGNTCIQLEPKWLDFLETIARRGISHFHTTDCFAGANEFEGLFSKRA